MHMKNQLKKAALAVAIQSVIVTPFAFAEDATEEDSGTLQKITVTAQKREQSAQEVPISVSTLLGEEFDAIFSAGDDVLSLANRVPGLYAESSNGRVAPRFYLRGLGNSDFDIAASQPVSIIMDDVVLENVALKSFPLFDLEGVEVIRGPQGTLFGRNTTAGIIKFTSRKPTQDADAYVNLTVAELGTQIVEAAYGGGLTDDLSFRISFLNQDRDDWISNSFTGEDDALGGFSETAYRLQVAYEPSDNLDMLFSFQGRDYDGTSTVFRGNAINTGSNELNINFDRNRVRLDGGSNSPQAYEGNMASLTVNYDLGDVVFTSITAQADTDGGSLGDIDGTSAPISESQDIADVEQFTQEFRFASDTDGDVTWQTGLFFYDGEFEITVDPFFIDPSTSVQTNETWAVFGQFTYDLTEQTTFVAGARYTEDEKTATAVSGAGIPIDPIAVDDSQVSWEIMLNHLLSDDVSVYGRVASGFRAQSIQVRDVAFFGTPSLAESETILSYEAGFKADLVDNTLRVNGAIYHYTIDDIQLTAVGGNGNNIGLDNADKGTGTGFEVDTVYRPHPDLTFTLGYSYTDTELEDSTLLIATCGSGQCTVLDPVDGSGNAFVNGNPFPNTPESTLNLTGRFGVPVETGEVYAYFDLARQGDLNVFIYESVEYNLGPQFELGLRFGYINDANNYEIALFGRNITDEANIKGGIDFANNTAFVNEPRVWGVEFSKRFF